MSVFAQRMGGDAERIVILPGSTPVDELGDIAPGAPAERPAWAIVAPRGNGQSAAELDERSRSGVIVGLSLFILDADNGGERVPLTYRDRVRWPADGTDVYEVEGEPGAWPGYGLEVALRRVSS